MAKDIGWMEILFFGARKSTPVVKHPLFFKAVLGCLGFLTLLACLALCTIILVLDAISRMIVYPGGVS